MRLSAINFCLFAFIMYGENETNLKVIEIVYVRVIIIIHYTIVPK